MSKETNELEKQQEALIKDYRKEFFGENLTYPICGDVITLSYWDGKQTITIENVLWHGHLDFESNEYLVIYRQDENGKPAENPEYISIRSIDRIIVIKKNVKLHRKWNKLNEQIDKLLERENGSEHVT